MENNKVIIIGGGAAGLSAAIYLARAGLTPLVFAGSPPGGQLMLTTEVENFPGKDSILGPELIDEMRKQAVKFGTTILDENVKTVSLDGSIKVVEAANGKIYRTHALIIATGARALWLGIESETRLRGKGVSACATCDAFFFRNKVVAIIGGGDSALEEALTLTKFASKVYVIHRREEFKASKIMQKRVLEHEKIEVVWNAQVVEIMGKLKVEGLKLRWVKISQPSADQLKSANEKNTNLSQSQPIPTDFNLKVDGVFVAIGHRPDTDIFKNIVELDAKGYLMTVNTIALENLKFEILNLKSNVDEENALKIKNLKLKIQKFNTVYGTQTSVDGIFGAGDCVDHVYKQASTAAGMGVQAALDAERWLESKA